MEQKQPYNTAPPAQTSAVSGEDHDKRNVYIQLRTVYTQEQLQQIADLCLRMVERARDRKCEQTLLIVFNDKGLPRYFNGSDNVMAVKP